MKREIIDSHDNELKIYTKGENGKSTHWNTEQQMNWNQRNNKSKNVITHLNVFHSISIRFNEKWKKWKKEEKNTKRNPKESMWMRKKNESRLTPHWLFFFAYFKSIWQRIKSKKKIELNDNHLKIASKS